MFLWSVFSPWFFVFEWEQKGNNPTYSSSTTSVVSGVSQLASSIIIMPLTHCSLWLSLQEGEMFYCSHTFPPRWPQRIPLFPPCKITFLEILQHRRSTAHLTHLGTKSGWRAAWRFLKNESASKVDKWKLCHKSWLANCEIYKQQKFLRLTTYLWAGVEG